MACAGNLLFTLANGQYTATTPGGTSIVIACVADGVSGWRLTATYLGVSNTYLPDASSTCTPFSLLFTDVVVDCGTINISLTSDLGPCTPSFSSSALPSSSSSSLSVSSTSGGGGTIPTTCCPVNLLPATVHATFSNPGGTCACLDGVTVALTYNGAQWAGTFTACSGVETALTLTCSEVLNTWSLIGSGPANSCAVQGSSSNFTCSPFNVPFQGATVSGCCLGTIDCTVTV